MQNQITMENLILLVMSKGKKDEIFEEEALFDKCLKYAEENNLYILTSEEIN